MMKKLFVVSLMALTGVVFISCQNSSGPSGGGVAPLVQGQAACYGSTSGHTLASVNITGLNTMTLTVGSMALCQQNPNVICTSITLCAPGTTTNCQTISDILVDTGSYGLRVFSQAIDSTICGAMTPVTDASSRPIGECQAFGIGADWGSVMKVDLQLGGEATVQVPIQVINASFSYMPSVCAQLQPDLDPGSSGYNGILGVGLFTNDCPDCAVNSSNGQYYACTSSSCSSVAVSALNQVQNPIALLATDNQGVVMDLPAASGNTSALTGAMYLGVGTLPNNTASASVHVYKADGTNNNGVFTTTYPYPSASVLSSSFIDSGSNAYFFAPVTDFACPTTSVSNGFLCPPSPTSYTTQQKGFGVTGNTNTVVFTIADPTAALLAGVGVIPNLGADGSGIFTDSFDWGSPFFFGTKVFTVIKGKTATSLTGTGPYWAY